MSSFLTEADKIVSNSNFPYRPALRARHVGLQPPHRGDRRAIECSNRWLRQMASRSWFQTYSHRPSKFNIKSVTWVLWTSLLVLRILIKGSNIDRHLHLNEGSDCAEFFGWVRPTIWGHIQRLMINTKPVRTTKTGVEVAEVFLTKFAPIPRLPRTP